MSPANGDHGRKTVTNGMRESFNVCMTSSAFIRGIIPFASRLVGRKKIESGSVNESPITETDAIYREKPRGAIRISVLSKGPRNLPLVRLGEKFCGVKFFNLFT